MVKDHHTRKLDFCQLVYFSPQGSLNLNEVRLFKAPLAWDLKVSPHSLRVTCRAGETEVSEVK